ncbi:TPA: GNAT family N-acetyltransferase [Serratia fonticola]
MVTDRAGRVLLVRKRNTEWFMQPGGKIESGERPEVALARDQAQMENRLAKAVVSRFSEDGDTFYCAVTLQDSGELIGEVLLKLASSAALQGEIGYIFNPVYAGKGYAAEAVRSVLERGFNKVGFHRIFARLDAANRSSIGVIERLGMRKEAHLRQNDRFNGRWGDELIYALLKQEWSRNMMNVCPF